MYGWVNYADKQRILTGFIFSGLLYAVFRKEF